MEFVRCGGGCRIQINVKYTDLIEQMFPLKADGSRYKSCSKCRVRTTKKCEHGKRGGQCRECGNGYCEHNRRRSRCTECSGQNCVHGEKLHRCVECSNLHCDTCDQTLTTKHNYDSHLQSLHHFRNALPFTTVYGDDLGIN